jgi:hypothetical protein
MKKTRGLKLIGFLKSLLLGIVIIGFSQPGVFAQGITGAPIDPPPGRPPSTEEIHRLDQITGMVLSSTPLDTKREFKGPSTVSVVKCHYDDAGFLSALRLDHASIWLDQDFYTLWAVASFPPVKPYSSRTLEPTMIICNGPGQARDTTVAESSIRQSVAKSLSQENGEKVIFTLIPGAFIEVFPNSIQLSDICSKENLVSISFDSLEQIRNSCWTKYSAAEILKSTNTIADLLDEWPTFFKLNIHPSRSSILAFAAHLNEKYKVLFAR